MTITCPTAMVKQEQIALRQSGLDALCALQRYSEDSFEDQFDEDTFSLNVSVVPSVKDLKMSTEMLEFRSNWIFDEATCGQLVYLYAEVSRRYLNKASTHFKYHGKPPTDLKDESLTIGSIDIGGGTTDLMICDYSYKQTGTTVIKPNPIYWESFNVAGDELLKVIIQTVIIGAFEKEMKKLGIDQIENRLNNFFKNTAGELVFGIHRPDRPTLFKMRKQFIPQIAIHVARKCLEISKVADGKPKTLKFDDLFENLKPNQQLLEFIKDCLGINVEGLILTIHPNDINECIDKTFEKLLSQISNLLFVAQCDIVLLSGRPCSLPRIRELMLQNFPVTPDRLIDLNSYRVGQWYPFQKGSGDFEKPKTIVAVGAMIALMGGKLGRLGSFRLDMTLMKNNLISTADFVGYLHTEINSITNFLLDPEVPFVTKKIGNVPEIIGMQKLKSSNYPSKPLYVLEYNHEMILERIKDREGEQIDPIDLKDFLTAEIARLEQRMDFEVTFERDFTKDKEKIIITNIIDNDGNELSPKTLKLKLKTISDDKSYWLDSGEFKQLRILG